MLRLRFTQSLKSLRGKGPVSPPLRYRWAAMSSSYTAVLSASINTPW